MKHFFQKHKAIFSALFSFLGTYALIYFGLRLPKNRLDLTNSVVSLLFFLFLFYATYRAATVMHRRLFWFSLFLGLAFGLMLGLGAELYQNNCVDWRSCEHWLGIACLTFVFAPLVALLLHQMPVWQKKVTAWAAFSKLPKQGLPYFFIAWLLIFLSFVPALLAAFPGIHAYDSVPEVYQLSGAGSLSSFHPVLHTLYLCGSLWIGKVLFSSYQIGQLIYSITQMLALSAIFAYACEKMARQGTPLLVQGFTFLFFTLWPIHAIFSVSSTKDVLFAGFLLLSVLFTMDLVNNTDAFLRSPWQMLRYIGVLFLMCAFRNNGILVLCCVIPFSILGMRNHRLKVAGIFLVAIGLWLVYTGPVYSLLHVRPGPLREMLSVPAQQLARATLYAGDRLEPADREEIYEIFPEKKIAKYRPRIADPVKDSFQEAVFRADMGKYLALWVRIGLTCPDIYLDAFLANNFALWYPDMVYPIPQGLHEYLEFRNPIPPADAIMITKTPVSQTLNAYYESIAYDTVHKSIPVISMLFSPGFATWVLFLLMGIWVYYREYACLLPALLPLMLIATLLFAPVVVMRYVYPVYVSLPVLVALLFQKQLGSSTVITPARPKARWQQRTSG